MILLADCSLQGDRDCIVGCVALHVDRGLVGGLTGRFGRCRLLGDVRRRPDQDRQCGGRRNCRG